MFAQMATAEATSIPQQVWQFLVKSWDVASDAVQKAGSIAFQRTLASTLNKIAYDSANYIGSGGKGQKPLYVTSNLNDYLNQISDEAGGQFIESFVNNLNAPDQNMTCQNKYNKNVKFCADSAKNTDENGVSSNTDYEFYTNCVTRADEEATRCAAKTANSSNAGNITPSFNVCSPSSVEAKLRISLGLIEQNRPKGPDCTYTEMIKSWETDALKKMADLRNPKFLDNFASIFAPQSNDLGIYLTAKADMAGQKTFKAEANKNQYVAGSGWLDVRDIAGTIQGVPGEARQEAEQAAKARQEALGKTTGDIMVDAANLFLNQLYISSFNNLMQQLTTKSKSNNNSSVQSPESSPQYGENALKEATSKLLKTNFGVRANYDVLSDLAICPDPKNPAPDNCVINDTFMQAVTERKTVAEAIKEGSLPGDWQFTNDEAGDSYHSSYSVRNITILVKYRILPLGWAEAARLVTLPKTGQKATLNDLVSCFDPLDSYAEYSEGFNKGQTDWCTGLVDPNWVLKAPLSYCKKSGFSAQILMQNNIPSYETNVSSTLSVSRGEDYCADSETCIKEKGDGSCEYYGYCNEEKRTWSFDADSCEPLNNTCQNFSNTTSGQSAAYLENTLDYTNCNSGSAGCRQYSWFGTYSTSSAKVSWDSSRSWYFNKTLATCSQSDEGCSELMRVKSTWGSNLVMAADFRYDEIGDSNQGGDMLNSWPLINNQTATIVSAAAESIPEGDKVLKLTATPAAAKAGISSSAVRSLLPADFQIIPGQAYALSADVYLVSGSEVELALGSAAAGFSTTTPLKNSWQHLSVVRQAENGYNEPDFSIVGYGPEVLFYLKNVKFELSEWATGFSPYGSFKTYEKLLPPYLEASCYVDTTAALKDYSLKSNAPAVCNKYARKCNQEEVGCELFSSVNDKFSIPAKVISSDYCRDACLGYDAYISKTNYFNSPYSENLIPANSTSCSAEAAGCNEFTNLDELSQGGEQREYYTSLKQCIKPNPDKCADFYSWEGQADGYQLQAYSLAKKTDGSLAVASNSGALCDATTYNLVPDDPRYNADCRQFYNVAGQDFYQLMSNTITCSNNCHTYRLSEKNIDSTIMASSTCVSSSRHWDANTNNCYSCLNGGLWDSQHQACIYQAIPGEGKTCQASDNGCREYNGNNGSNVRVTAVYDFENNLSDWSSNCSSGVSSSTISNSKDGHSLWYHDTNYGRCNTIGSQSSASYTSLNFPLIKKILAGENVAAQHSMANIARAGAAYTVKFIARAAVNTNIKIYFFNNDSATPAKTYFNASGSLIIKGGNGWNVYQANLANLDHAIGPKELLVISADSDFYLDNFVLSEITDRYYLIKNSSQVPAVCSYDIFNTYQGPEYNLGCSQYTDRNGSKHDLNRFNQLCASSAVGCEQMIDTRNSTDYRTNFWFDRQATTTCAISDPNCVKVEGDRALYAVYDANKQCGEVNKGCSRLGQGQGGALVSSWLDFYGLNNPDQYTNILCSQKNAGCEEWQSDNNSKSYFKDPGAGTCNYRNSNNPAVVGKAWYKIPVKRCDRNNNSQIDGSEKGSPICLSDSDCSVGKCLIDNNDYLCSTSYLKTIGLGGANNQVPTPDKDAGLCNGNQAGCQEYIDPVSRFSANLVNNPSYKKGSDNIIVGWGPSINKWPTAVAADQQVIRLEPNKLYSFNINVSTNAVASPVELTFLDSVRLLQADNNFSAPASSLFINSASAGGINQPLIFNSLNNKLALVSYGNNQKNIEVKELAINYQLANSVDKETCENVKFDSGCVLFNERAIAGASGFTPLSADAYNTPETANGSPIQSCTAPYCQANQLIKVHPDRVCAKWLDCLTYFKDPSTQQKTCYSFGQCDRLDDQGECSNFITNVSADSKFNVQNDKNASGYALADSYNFSTMKEVGSKISGFNAYDFEGSDPAFPKECATTVDFVSSESCEGWDNPDRSNSAKVIKEPKGAPTDYPAEGSAYLQVPARLQLGLLAANSPLTVLSSGDNFYLRYLINTKNSNGLKTKLIITDENNVVWKDSNNQPLVFYADSPKGWTRVVKRFNLGTGVKQIKIFLSSNTQDSKDSSSVYFDDITIEPVLDMGNNNYAARDCRLYPAGDSLACINTDNNVIKNGLEGYCLKYDPANPRVCLLWYPMDRIAGATDKLSVSGYQGKFPLNYCTEANGNFQVVEKRTQYLDSASKAYSGDCQNAGEANDGRKNDYNSCNGNNNYWKLYFEFSCHEGNDCCHTEWCIPKTRGEIQAMAYHNTNFHTPTITHDFGNLEGSTGIYDSSTPMPEYNDIFGEYVKLYLNLKNDVQHNSSGWYYPFNGFSGNEGDSPIRIYDPTKNPVTEADLNYLPNDTNANNPYRLTCNRFTSVVDNNGDNKAWVGRVSTPTTVTTTPAFFYKEFSQWPSGLLFSSYLAYHYNREVGDIPFGAASWPTNFSLQNNNSRVNLRAKGDSSEDPAAGRPYGCSGPSCNMIGSCSNNPNIYCLATSSDNNFLADETCGGGTGRCIRLWEKIGIVGGSIPNYSQTQYLLANVFLKSNSSYSFNTGLNKYLVDNSSFDFSSSISQCVDNIRDKGEPNIFCVVYPTLSNVSLYYGDNKEPINPINPGDIFNISQRGIYRLEFNTSVDSEQLPLKQIDIDWGDGNTQIINDQDQKPAAAAPHSLYHYYREAGSRTIKLKITDNWGKYDDSYND
ncbi:MAG: hypothetical protein WC863_00575 [Patescibacteria group bacterium]